MYFQSVLPPASPIDVLNCKHEGGKVNRVADITGTTFDLLRCKHCGMEFVFKLDKEGKAVSGYWFPPEGWVH
jgi:hypothetical protein